MGVDYRSYVGFGIKLADQNTYDELIDKFEACEVDIYDIEFSDEHIELVDDGMCGQYMYLLYKLNEFEVYDCDSENTEISLSDFKELLGKVPGALKEACELLKLNNFNVEDVKFISFTHAY